MQTPDRGRGGREPPLPPNRAGGFPAHGFPEHESRQVKGLVASPSKGLQGDCGVKQAPIAEKVIRPTEVQIGFADSLPLVAPVENLSETPAHPTDDVTKRRSAVAIAEVVVPST